MILGCLIAFDSQQKVFRSLLFFALLMGRENLLEQGMTNV